MSIDNLAHGFLTQKVRADQSASDHYRYSVPYDLYLDKINVGAVVLGAVDVSALAVSGGAAEDVAAHAVAECACMCIFFTFYVAVVFRSCLLLG